MTKGCFSGSKTPPYVTFPRLLTILFFLMGAWSASAQDQPTVTLPLRQLAQTDETFAFEISAKPLPQALNDFGRITGMTVLFTEDKPIGHNSPRLFGRFTAAQALGQLLAGSGFTYRLTDPRTVTLERTQLDRSDERVRLEPTTVEGHSIKIEETQVTAEREQEQGYVVKKATTATKTDTPIFEQPMSVQVVPQAVINDQKSTYLKDALRNVSSVQVSGNGYNGLYDVFAIRGFQLGFGQVYRDGFRQSVSQVDLANIERVEVLKGASGGLYGRIEPGGLINLVTKKPSAEARYSLEQQFGEYQHFRTIADATGPLTADKSLLYRVVFGYQDSSSFRDEVENDRLLISPTLTWDPTPSTHFHVNLEYKKTHDRMDTGLVALGDHPVNIPRGRFIGLKDMPDSPTEHWLTDAWVTHAFNDDWSVKLRGAWWKYDQTTNESGPFDEVNADERTVDLYLASPYNSFLETYFTELSVAGKLRGYGLEHSLLFAVEYYNFYNSQFSFFDGAPTVPLEPLDVFAPAYQSYNSIPLQKPRDFGFQRDEWFGFTMQDTIAVTDRLTLLLSGRFDTTESVSAFCSNGTDSCAAADETKSHYDVFSPRFGFNFRLIPSLALFASYAESFADSKFGFLKDGSVTDPETATQYEIGFKGQWLEGRVNATLDYFHLTKENVTTPTVDPFVVEQTGEARSQGVEFDMSGELTEQLSLIGHYAYLDTEITKDNDETGGSRNTGNGLPNAPRHSGSLWAKLDLGNGLGFGAGVFVVGRRRGDLANSFDLPGYVRFDTSASYRFRVGQTWITAQLNAYNLFDEDYFEYSSGRGRTFIYPGAPRTLIGSLRFEF